ncbi:MAG TPA: hypothetical protein VGD05_05800 [Pyrinomonadaceae bacterium]|jgi:hypothetical protein
MTGNAATKDFQIEKAKDVSAGQINKKISRPENLPLNYFSYPFLNTGKSADDRVKFESWRASRGLSAVK